MFCEIAWIFISALVVYRNKEVKEWIFCENFYYLRDTSGIITSFLYLDKMRCVLIRMIWIERRGDKKRKFELNAFIPSQLLVMEDIWMYFDSLRVIVFDSYRILPKHTTKHMTNVLFTIIRGNSFQCNLWISKNHYCRQPFKIRMGEVNVEGELYVRARKVFVEKPIVEVSRMMQFYPKTWVLEKFT